MKFLSIVNYAALAAAAVVRRGNEEAQISGRDISANLFSELDFYVQWAEAAYCNAGAANLSTVTCAFDNCPQVEANGATILTTFTGDETDVAVIIGIDPTRKEIVVSYRGTIDIRNWIVNLSFAQSSCSDLTSGCKVHHGFQWAWSETGSVVMAAVAEAKQKYPTYNVIATGHSLGAAMATIATAYLRQAGHATDLYTYGSPRVGNLAFVEFVTNQGGSENRVTKLDDPVPRLPPIFTGYRHTSPEYWIDEGTDASDNITASEITTCLGYANTDCNAGQLGFSITAHLNYFQHTGSCDTGESSKRGLEGSSVAASFVSDEDLEEQLKIYFQQDIDYAKSKRL